MRLRARCPSSGPRFFAATRSERLNRPSSLGAWGNGPKHSRSSTIPRFQLDHSVRRHRGPGDMQLGYLIDTEPFTARMISSASPSPKVPMTSCGSFAVATIGSEVLTRPLVAETSSFTLGVP